MPQIHFLFNRLPTSDITDDESIGFESKIFFARCDWPPISEIFVTDIEQRAFRPVLLGLSINAMHRLEANLNRSLEYGNGRIYESGQTGCGFRR